MNNWIITMQASHWIIKMRSKPPEPVWTIGSSKHGWPPIYICKRTMVEPGNIFIEKCLRGRGRIPHLQKIKTYIYINRYNSIHPTEHNSPKWLHIRQLRCMLMNGTKMITNLHRNASRSAVAAAVTRCLGEPTKKTMKKKPPFLLTSCDETSPWARTAS